MLKKVCIAIGTLFVGVIIGAVFLVKNHSLEGYPSDLPEVGGVPGLVMLPSIAESSRLGQGLLSEAGIFPSYDKVKFWTPEKETLSIVEQHIEKFIKQHPPGYRLPKTDVVNRFACWINEEQLVKEILEHSFRQYVGLEIDDSRFVYVNGVPPKGLLLDPSLLEIAKRKSILFMDGGPGGFQLMFSVDSQKVLAVNYGSYVGSKCMR